MAKSLLDQATVYGSRAKLGVIVPPTNTANEAEWNQMAPAGVSIHAARMPLHSNTASEEGLGALYNDIEYYASDLAQASVSAIAYGCTAGSMVEPISKPAQFMKAKTGLPAVTTAQAIVEALRALQVNKISLATPYHQALNNHEVKFLAGQEIAVSNDVGLGYGENGPAEYRNIARIPLASVHDLVRQVDQPEAQAILISCTDLASLALIATLESELQKPVISSNTATFWAALRLAGIKDSLSGYGILLERH